MQPTTPTPSPEAARMWRAAGAPCLERDVFVVQPMRRQRARSVSHGFRVTHFFHGGKQRLASHILPDKRAVRAWIEEREYSGPKTIGFDAGAVAAARAAIAAAAGEG